MKITVILSALLMSSAALLAQGGRNVVERADDHRQITYDKETLDRDAHELAAFKEKAELLQKAHDAGDKARTQTLKAELVQDMKREIEQTENKLARAKTENKLSVSEVNSDYREIRHDRADLRNGNHRGEHDKADLARDKANRADDARDVRDDRQDAASLEKRLQNQRALLAAVDSNPKESILGFIQTMENDLAGTKGELHEDKGELHEDRRETRDDHRERRD